MKLKRCCHLWLLLLYFLLRLICQNKFLLAVVKVEVKHHKITSIEILEHKTSYMKHARHIAVNVCSVQSLDVDAVSGALSSVTV
jgi:uncharacterized protein with FMN-binding domain